MKKYLEHSKPQSCWNKAQWTERLFILLERDAVTASTIRWWAAQRVQAGLNKADDKQIMEAIKLAEEIDQIHLANKPTPCGGAGATEGG